MRRLILAPLVAAAVFGLAPITSSFSEAAGRDATTAYANQVAGAVSEGPSAVSRPLQTSPSPPSAELVSLRRDLAEITRNSGSRNGNYSVLVVSLDRGDTLFSLNPDLPLAPASNMKLFSTAAALYYLGPNFRYSTYALADGEIRDGILLGDLVLYGTGDPAISSRMLSGALTPLRALADSLAANGIREIAGNVVGDGSYFDDGWIGPGWRPEYRLDSYSAPVGALSLSENVVSVRVSPGGGAGQPAQIRTTPATAGLMVNNRVSTVTSGGTSVRFSYDPTGLAIEGRIARGHPGLARTVTVTDPANFAAAAFRGVLEEAGIVVRGEVSTVRLPEASPVTGRRQAQGDGATPPPRVIGTHLSPTLGEVATVTNHVSQNLFAEALFKTVGRVVIGEGSFAAGARAVLYFMECEKPFDSSGLNIVDGSGLSPENRVTTRATVHLLDLMTRTEVADVFRESLPMAASPRGGAHSLRNRMGGTPAANNLRAKTGTISNVSSLSGYVEAANGELLAFSIFVNNVPSTWTAKRMEDAVGARLARFTRPEPAPPMVPMESEPATLDLDADSVSLESGDPTMETPRAPATTPAEPPSPTASTRTHEVANGESFDVIARRYGLTTAQLQAANPGIQPRRLQIGHTLTIPAGSDPGAPTTTAAARTHRVASGETFDGIARRYGVSVSALRSANGNIQPRRLQIGQTLTIPPD